ncbi:hypothetical protein P3X46_017637 [Hevea brasiliensis]|uniref:Sieve element occlusion N-terminal domain-containing protein n=1 Tax=Hevea brasiliensis TaxID=3981 RepID=A0ABQ9LQ41_HEVBR|nr:hypothetical protein P3X46_017637 [Hevea brasiliensis]
MNFFGYSPFSLHSSPASWEENILIMKILLTHDPDGRHLDSELLLCAMVNVMCYTATSEVQMLFKNAGKGDLHTRTMVLFDLLGNYRWDAKVALIFAAFATSYGEFWLIMQLYPGIKQVGQDNGAFDKLSKLVKTMVHVTKCIIKFEDLPLSHVKLDDEAMAIAKSYIYIASYWVTRSTLACSSQIRDLIARKPKQVSTCIMATLSLVYRLSGMYSCFSRQSKLYQKLLNLLQEVHADNQEVLGMLLCLKDELPLKNSSTQEKLLPLEGLFLLVHQTYDHPPYNKVEESYELVLVPISFSDKWSYDEAERFNLLSNSLPWYSIRRPWSLNSAVVNYIKQLWNFKDDPLMVVLNSQGMVTNSNAIDMILIWGAKAFSFSSSREKQLWEERELDSATFVEGRNICIYGSDNPDWIREFNAKMKEIRSVGVQIEMVYVGSRHLSERVRHILATINEEMHSSFMRRSIFRPQQSISSDHIQEAVSALLDSTDEGWAVIGKGNTTDIVKLQGTKTMECLNKFSGWEENVIKLGFLGALRSALEEAAPLPGPCNNSNIVPYNYQLKKL